MIRKVYLGSILCVLFLAPPAIHSQDSPESLVKEFFIALKADDTERMRELATIDRYEHISDAGWIEVWKGVEVISYEGFRASGDSGTFDERGYVSVIYSPSKERMLKLNALSKTLPDGKKKESLLKFLNSNPTKKNSISVVRKGDKWYWDER